MLAQMLQSSVPNMANMTEQSRSSAETIGTDDADSIRVDSPESETGTGSGNDDRAAREASLTRYVSRGFKYRPYISNVIAFHRLPFFHFNDTPTISEHTHIPIL